MGYPTYAYWYGIYVLDSLKHSRSTEHSPAVLLTFKMGTQRERIDDIIFYFETVWFNPLVS